MLQQLEVEEQVVDFGFAQKELGIIVWLKKSHRLAESRHLEHWYHSVSGEDSMHLLSPKASVVQVSRWLALWTV